MNSISSTVSPFAPPSTSTELPANEARIERAFAAYEHRVFVQTNQLFWWLLLAQWAFAVLVAAVWSPQAWAGEESTVHPHLVAAIALGGLLVIPPLLLIRHAPLHWMTRHSVAVAQVVFSALLIHLTGGRIETHFHVFGSLAFLALYRDWRVIVTATLVVAFDHLLRGLWYPASVYGVPYATAWRTVEHAGWVLFEDIVLIWACFVSRREMEEICRRNDQNHQLLDQLEERVRERTAALVAEIDQHERTTAELRTSELRYRTLVDNAPIGIFKTTRAGEVRFANPYLLQLVGLPASSDLAGLNLADGRMFAREERERLWQKLETDLEVRGFETSYTRVDGTRIDIVINARLGHSAADGAMVCEGTVEDVTQQRRAQRDLEKVHQQLMVASRQAGMADVATGVLHNVGNVLTSVNITIHYVLERLQNSRLSVLHRVVEMFQREGPRLGVYLTEDPHGRQMPEFLGKLDRHLAEENQQLRADIESLVKHFTHIREVIVTQQSTARLFGVSEKIEAEPLFEDALKLSTHSLARHGIALERRFAAAAAVKADRHKVLQILVNLLKNAKDAVLTGSTAQPQIRVSIAPAGTTHVAFTVCDNGIGIPPENLTKIFSHGFTTKADGHGFGLHSCVLAARDMHGDLTATSAGPGQGAVFTLTLPVFS